MKKVLLNIVIFVILFGGGIVVANYTITGQQDNKRELSFRREIVFSIDALEEYQDDPNEETLRVIASHIYAARELSEDEMWNALHELWNALLFDDDKLLNYIDILISSLNKYNANEIEDIAMNIRIDGKD